MRGRRKHFPSSELLEETSIYVGDIDKSVSKHELYCIFSERHEIEDVVIPNKNGIALGYAYIRYKSPNQAKRALKRFGCSVMIRGKPCRIMKYSKRLIECKNNVFVKNLHQTIDNKTLHNVFSKYGEIISVKIATNAADESLGYGYISYKNKESALLAVEKTNGKYIKGTILTTEAFQSKKDRFIPFTNVYVKHIPPSWDEQKILKLFGKHGNITSHNIKHTSMGTSACFNYENTKQAQNVINKLNQLPFGQYTLFVARAQKKSQRQIALRKLHQGREFFLFVANVPYFVDNRCLKRVFYRFGNVTSGYIQRLENGRSKGQGIIGFDNQQSAMDAQFQMNGSFHFGNKLYVAKARDGHQNKQPLFRYEKKRQRPEPPMEINVVNYDSDSSSESLSDSEESERKIVEITRVDNAVNIENDMNENEEKEEKIKMIDDELRVRQSKLQNWLENTVKLPQYLSLFIENGVEDLETVQMIKEEDLKGMGMKKLGHIKKMGSYIERLKQETEEGDVDDINLNNRFLQ